MRNFLNWLIHTKYLSAQKDLITIYTTSQKFGHTFSFEVFLILMTIYIVDSQGINTMNEHIWNYVVNKKV